jgi:hypothetical protein
VLRLTSAASLHTKGTRAEWAGWHRLRQPAKARSREGKILVYFGLVVLAFIMFAEYSLKAFGHPERHSIFSIKNKTAMNHNFIAVP